jgi:membrane protein involved in colicin uptake
MSDVTLSAEAQAKEARNKEKNEAKRKEKADKFEAKKKMQAEKQALSATKTGTKASKKPAAAELPKFVNTTVEGDLKDFSGLFISINKIHSCDGSFI